MSEDQGRGAILDIDSGLANYPGAWENWSEQVLLLSSHISIRHNAPITTQWLRALHSLQVLARDFRDLKSSMFW